MKIIVPMAGMGKRMSPHKLTVPKTLVPIAGKPIVHRLVEDIASVSDEKVTEVAFIISLSFGEEVEKSLKEIAQFQQRNHKHLAHMLIINQVAQFKCLKEKDNLQNIIIN